MHYCIFLLWIDKLVQFERENKYLYTDKYRIYETTTSRDNHLHTYEILYPFEYY